MSLLEVTSLCVNYGGIKALKGVSFTVDEGQIITLIGANGAGKSTILRTISGLVKPTSGSVMLAGTDLTKLKPKEIVKNGVVLVPEGRRIFPNLSVRENLTLGAYLRNDRELVNQDIEKMYGLFPILRQRSWQYAGTLSGGEQQMLAVGRAMMSRPKLLLLDEPSMGLAPNLVDLIFELILKINQRGTTILLIEQNANMALQIADRGYVLETGRVTMTDNARTLQANDNVRKAYLGSA